MKDLGEQSQLGTACTSEYFPFALASYTRFFFFIAFYMFFFSVFVFSICFILCRLKVCV